MRQRMDAFTGQREHAERVDSVLPDVSTSWRARQRLQLSRPNSFEHPAAVSGLVRVGWAAIVLGSALSAVAFWHAHRGPFPLLALVLAVTSTLPLLAIRHWPLAALGLVLASDATFIIWARLPWPPAAVAVWLLALAALPLLLRRKLAVMLLIATEVVVIAGAFVPTSVNPRPWDAPITEALASLLVWGGAEALRAGQESERRRVQVDEELRGLQQRAVAARGRAEIARELHDVVAHHVSLIAVRAATAPYQLGDVSEATARAFTEIATEARAALDDLRTVLGVLRNSDVDLPQAPQPRLADLPELMERLRSNGMTLSFEERGVRAPLGVVLELCCYRVIQEALTNSARYAPGSPVEVTVEYRDVELAVTVADQGSLLGQDRPISLGTGFGLTGMRERVAALGGNVTAAPEGAGFRVAARIPIQLPE
jgi:signal transduction histidine kinase